MPICHGIIVPNMPCVSLGDQQGGCGTLGNIWREDVLPFEGDLRLTKNLQSHFELRNGNFTTATEDNDNTVTSFGCKTEHRQWCPPGESEAFLSQRKQDRRLWEAELQEAESKQLECLRLKTSTQQFSNGASEKPGPPIDDS
ncbi:hypothetical protein EYF80_004432 [Liparis tanakae]|uniref:Uncharacterized protein n=1 Tax=Liparis tanakae TaxID=230148 RepID=A0A4Z2J5F4_9TELE|nr:hypothetical protein EYF80_004432 [Liparis tanakae]